MIATGTGERPHLAELSLPPVAVLVSCCPILHGSSMGPVPDGTTRLKSRRQIEVCRLCDERPRSVDDLAEEMQMAGGGAVDATVKRLAEHHALVEAGHGPPRGTRKQGAKLWALAPDWKADLAVALARQAPGRIE